MEYLQYTNAFSTQGRMWKVLNLVINGIPSILNYDLSIKEYEDGFKPCYKWNTFNTQFVLNIYH